MTMPPFSTDGIVADPIRQKPRLPKSRLLAGLAVTLALLASGSAEAGFLDIGTVNTFKTSSSLGNPTGTWTLGDKDWTYLSDSGNWTGIEDIQLLTNFNPLIYSHQFLISNLSGYSFPITLQLGYQAHINGANGPNWVYYDARMGEDTSGATVNVWQDIYGSLADYTTYTAPGSGTLMTHMSVNGSLPPAGVFPGGLTDIWGRNSITLALEFDADTPRVDPRARAGVLIKGAD